MGFPLTADQRRAVEDRGGPLLVSAAAGAGKTRVLVERLMDRIRKGADVDQFLVITFTNDAAAELKTRVVEELDRALAEAPGDKHLRRQLTLVYQSHISTVHAFCGETLREWGHLMDIPGDYRLCDEGEGLLLQEEALTEALEARYEKAEEGDGFSLLLDAFDTGRDDSGLRGTVLTVYRKLQSHADPESWLKDQREGLKLEGVGDVSQTPWGAYLLSRYRERAGYWLRKWERLTDACRGTVKSYLPSMEATLAGLAAMTRAQTWDGMEAPEFPRLKPKGKDDDPDVAEEVKNARERYKRRIQGEFALLERTSADLLADLDLVAPAMDGLLALVADFSAAFDALKRRRNVLDFNDLEHKALALLRGFPQAAESIRGRFREVMVDEYQDTNRVQSAIFDALTGEEGRLFLVGDVKQSIYRFRLADPTLFLEKYRTWAPSETAGEGQGRRVTLGENFRSGKEVVDTVNYLFANLMSEELGELDYGEEESLRQGNGAPAREEDRTELYLLENPKADLEGTDAMAEPRLVAARLAKLLEDGLLVNGGEEGLRPVRPSDMAILLRSPGPVLSRYVRALAERGIPWESEGGEDFFDAPETAVALSYLEIIDNPRQDVPLIAVLRSPVYGFSPDRLAQLRTSKGDGCFYDALTRDEGEDVRAFLEELEELRFLTADLRSWEVIWEVYRRTGLLDVYAAMEEGDVRREHLMALYGYARKFEGSGHKGLFGFLHHLRRRRERGEAMKEPGDRGGSGVRILSIHKSKGLEFPVVVVAGLGKEFNDKDLQAPALFHQELGLGTYGIDRARGIRYKTLARWAVARKLKEETRSEELRLLYVALTRAREKLILTMTTRDSEKLVSDLLEDATLPPDPQGLLGMKSVGEWVLSAALGRPEAGRLRGVTPGPVVPADMELGEPWVIKSVDGLPYWTRPKAEGQVVEETEGEETIALPDYSWRYPYSRLADVPSKLTATQLKGREQDREAAEDAVSQPRPIQFDRPWFALEEKGLTAGERGTAHHLVMQFLDFARTGSEEELRGEIDRLTGERIITPQQGAAVDPAVLLAFFRSDLGREALGSGSLHREFKFSVLDNADRYYQGLPEGETVLLQGVIDCWYETPEGVAVIDFKSDRVTEDTAPARAEEYRPQIDAYSRALSLLAGKPVVRRALWFFSLGKMIEL